jgi:sugar-specific transcriptional regulator TrmB
MKASSLESLGLTQMESLAYAYLVANPASTGYRIARGIGKPTANVYRALESLERKGAVVHDRSATPSFRAIAPDDLLTRLERDFLERKALASRELAALRPDEGDERLYTLASPSQVIARARTILASARRLVMLEAPDAMAETLAQEIRDARSRGVRTVTRMRGATPADSHADDFVEAGAPQPGSKPALRMVADAREALLASLSPDGSRVRDAVWTRSDFFARTLHDALTSELLYRRIERGLSDGLSVDEVEGAFELCRELREMM